MKGVKEAVRSQHVEVIAQPLMECVSLEERLLLSFFRQLNEPDRLFMRRSIEAMVATGRPD